MEPDPRAEAAAEAVKTALLKIEEEHTHLKDILKAFGGILVEQARWKAVLPEWECGEGERPDPVRFGQGVSVARREALMRLGTLWPTAVERIFPFLVEGFPKIGDGFARLGASIRDGGFPPDLFLDAALNGYGEAALELARKVDLDPGLIEFALAQAARPALEKRSLAYGALIKDLAWNKGHCPVCGSMPGLSLLREKEGQRWLRCGFCAAEWRFIRMSCPCCEGQEPDDRELLFVEGREHEKVEVCHKCKKYIIGIDVRALSGEFIPEVAALGLLHLDILAQQKGFAPMYGSGLQGLA